MANININDIKAGDILSEASHYVVSEIPKNSKHMVLLHLESKKLVKIENQYIGDMMKGADQYIKTVKVGKDDKYWTAKQIEEAVAKNTLLDNQVKIGDVRQEGIRTIWDKIDSTQVFTVCFVKKDEVRPKKEIQAEIEARVALLIEKMAKTPMSEINKVLTDTTTEQVYNPIKTVNAGEERILRGYKNEFKSLTGFYDCVDMDIVKGSNIRPVNINTIKWLVYDNVKYVLE